ncbi:MAG: Dephospho-CoA kinase [Phycisphaerae bacterium]|nr:Dephospho-CoA kinase [Phycisphaerae bacterium]
METAPGCKKPLIGLCGGIGSGKSAVAAELARLGCLIIDSDRMSHAALETEEVRERLRSWWGGAVFDAAGRVDRRAIGKIVFGSEAERRRLEMLVHPLIERWRVDIIQRSSGDPAVKAIVLDSPLLFESGLNRLCHAVIFVDADDASRLARLRASRGWTGPELAQRERWQIPLEQKRSQADYIVDNNGPADRLGTQVADILNRIVSEATSHDKA